MHGPGDNSRGAVMSADGLGDYELTYSLETQQRDLSDFRFLQFRAAQATRHPLTTTDIADLTFSVALEDGTGAASSINIGAYGGGVEEPIPAQLQSTELPCLRRRDTRLEQRIRNPANSNDGLSEQRQRSGSDRRPRADLPVRSVLGFEQPPGLAWTRSN